MMLALIDTTSAHPLRAALAEAISAAGLIHDPAFLLAGLQRRARQVDVDFQAALDALAADVEDAERRAAADGRMLDDAIRAEFARRRDQLEVERVEAYVCAARSALAPLGRSLDAGRSHDVGDAIARVIAELRVVLEARQGR
jgi:hypothetical protein